jgi:beta-1,4-glucuronyltransferase 1
MRLSSFKSLNTFKEVQRTGDLATWEPIFVGTKLDPPYDERLSWEGKSDKMPQV